MLQSFRSAVAESRRHGGLYFAALRIEKAFGDARGLWRGWICTPATTLWVFLSQCLSADHSCRDAIARLIAWRLAEGKKPCSADTGAYCTARTELPEEALHGLVGGKGFRTKSLVVVTTLRDAKKYPPEEIARLYRRRWQAELHLRSLKIVLQMDHLRCKTPERVRKEFWTHLLGFAA
jgi:IS4 transposase